MFLLALNSDTESHVWPSPAKIDKMNGGWRMFTLIGTLIIGLIVGALAKLIMPGQDPGGIWITMALGVAGSLVATYLGRALGWYATGQSAGFVRSVLGALLLLLLYRFIRGRPAKA